MRQFSRRASRSKKTTSLAPKKGKVSTARENKSVGRVKESRHQVSKKVLQRSTPKESYTNVAQHSHPELDSSVQVCPNYPRTDAGNAELFAHGFRHRLRYNHKRERWMVWLGHWWAEDLDGVVLRGAKKIARFRFDAALLLDDKDVRKQELAWAIGSESRYRLESLVKLAKSEFPLADTGDRWDADPMLVGTANGVLDLRTGELRDGHQSDRITMHTDTYLMRLPRRLVGKFSEAIRS